MAKKYVFVGASNRGYHAYALPLYQSFSDCATLCGVFDTNKGRSVYLSEHCGNIPVFDDFDAMMTASKPDVAIITTVDAFHSDYIVRALAHGCDVITEKPMTIDAERCRAILEAEKKYGRKVTVIFNFRYLPFAAKMKELVSGGAIGDVYSVHFEWLLDRIMAFGAHGTSYFRRWNSHMEKCGGLLLHKSTHHFDIVNWIIGAAPKKVSAFGKLNLYGANGPYRGENCRSCTHTKECPFYYKLSAFETEFYADNEHLDGYYKDGCVFAEDIDIYDTMSLNVLYDGGQMMSYSLNATAAYEGWRMSINGSKGRLEAFLPATGFQSEDKVRSIKVFDLQNNMTEYRISPVGAFETHDGSDDFLREMLFRGAPDPLGQTAGTLAGAHSLMIGAAANVSIRDGVVADIDELLWRKVGCDCE